MPALLDNFNRPDTTSGFGAVPAGFAYLFSPSTGGWRIVGQKAVTTTPATGDPHAVTVSTRDAEVGASVSFGGGDAVYARVVDPNNWLRAMVRVAVTTTTSTYTVTEYEWRGTYGFDNGPYHSHLEWEASPSTHTLPGTCSHGVPRFSAAPTGQTRQSTRTGSRTTTNRSVVLQKRVAGVISTLGQWTVTMPTTSLRLRCVSDLLTVTASGFALGTARETAHMAATRHGIGRGFSPSNGTALDNLSVESLNSAPSAPTLISPVGGVTVNRDESLQLRWSYKDIDVGDTQSKYELQYRLIGGATTTVTRQAPTTAFGFVGGLTSGNYEWRVRTYDQSGTVGPYSAWAPFTSAIPPDGPTITSPSNAGTVGAAEHVVTWSAAAQDAYELRTVGDNVGTADPTVIYSSVVHEDQFRRSRAVTFPVTGRFEHVQLRVRVAGIWSPWASVRILVSYIPPQTPVVTLRRGARAIIVEAFHPRTTEGTTQVVSVDVWRRDTGKPTTSRRVARDVPPGATWPDYLVGHRQDVEYQVTARGDNGTESTTPWLQGDDDTIPTPPNITRDPVSVTVTVNETAAFAVEATGTLPLTYQWETDATGVWAPIPGATEVAYQTNPLPVTTTGRRYRVVVTNEQGPVTSAPATVTVTALPTNPPVITVHPVSRTAAVGATATFAVGVSGAGPFTYQWQHDSGTGTFANIVVGGTAATYTTPTIDNAANGRRYLVIVRNAAGSVTSLPATLTVSGAVPVITSQPSPVTAAAGATATFRVTASNATSYQWETDATGSFQPVIDATSPIYTTPPVDASYNGRRYRVIVSNAVAPVTSAMVALTVSAAPAAPFLDGVLPGENVAGLGFRPGPGTVPTGYIAEVEFADLVSAVPTFTRHPAPVTVTAGTAAGFTVDAEGAPAPSYQWQQAPWTVNTAGVTWGATTAPVPGTWPRMLNLGNGVWLKSTGREVSPTKRVIDIYRSTDGTATWSGVIATIDGGERWVGRGYLHRAANGNILLAATNHNPGETNDFRISQWTSTNGGSTFGGEKIVAAGSGAGNGVWEPNYYRAATGVDVLQFSDERQAESQVISQLLSATSGATYAAPTFIASDGLTGRPGMSHTARMADGRYIMVYEVGVTAPLTVHYKISHEGVTWPAGKGTLLSANMRTAPHVLVLPTGRILVSAARVSNTDFSVPVRYSDDNGATWTAATSPFPTRYTLEEQGGGWNSMYLVDPDRIRFLTDNQDRLGTVGTTGTWANIAGATEAGWITESLPVSANGRLYRSVATNTAGPATSLAAPVTVLPGTSSGAATTPGETVIPLSSTAWVEVTTDPEEQPTGSSTAWKVVNT